MNPDDPLGLIGPPKPAGDPLGLLSTPHLPTKLEIAKREAAKRHPEDMEDPDSSYAQKALGGIAALAHDIPGAEALQATARTLRTPGGSANLATPEGRAEFGKGYRESLSDIQQAEESAPAPVRVWNNVAGGTIAALAGPKGGYMNPLGKGGSAAAQAARFGAAQGLFSAEPASIQDRLLKAGKGGTLAAVTAGIVGDVAPNVARVIKAKSLGRAAMQRGAQMTTADETAYGKALQEGQGLTHPDVTAALDSPGIKGYSSAARKAPSLAGSDDATILHETYKRLGERQRGLEAQVERAASFKAGPAREIQDIELMKRKLLDAADKIMPGYRAAVEQHAKLAGQTEAFENAADQTKRVINKTSVAGRNLQKNTAEAFKAQIIKLDKAKAEAAREALLGRVQEQASDALNKNPFKGFGIPKSLSAINRASPFLQELDEQAEGPSSGLLRRALATGIGAHVSN